MITPHLRFSQMTSRDHVHATFSQKLRVRGVRVKSDEHILLYLVRLDLLLLHMN